MTFSKAWLVSAMMGMVQLVMGFAGPNEGVVFGQFVPPAGASWGGDGSYENPYFYDEVASPSQQIAYAGKRGQTSEFLSEHTNGLDFYTYQLQQRDKKTVKYWDPAWGLQRTNEVTGYRLQVVHDWTMDGAIVASSDFTRVAVDEKSVPVPQAHAAMWDDFFRTTQTTTFDYTSNKGKSTVVATVNVLNPQNGVRKLDKIEFVLDHEDKQGSGSLEENNYVPPYLDWKLTVKVEKLGFLDALSIGYGSLTPITGLPSIGCIADHLTTIQGINFIAAQPDSFTGNWMFPVEQYEPEWDEEFLIAIFPAYCWA